MMNKFVKLIRDQRGANMAEYLILTAVVAIGGMAGFSKLSGGLLKALTSAGELLGGLVGK